MALKLSVHKSRDLELYRWFKFNDDDGKVTCTVCNVFVTYARKSDLDNHTSTITHTLSLGLATNKAMIQ